MNESTRYVKVGEPNDGFCLNVVSNTKYTPQNFIFKNLYEQFRQPMNCYFLLIAILQLFPQITVNNPWTTWLPLAFIFSVSAIRELNDDIKRSKSDTKANNKPVRILKGNTIVEVQSKDVRVGDILYLKEDEEIPCDCVVLYCSNSNGLCYIQTTNIDGETNLKMRNASPSIQSVLEPEGSFDEIKTSLSKMHIGITCPTPNSHIYQFPAVVSIASDREAAPKEEALSGSNLLLQVCHVRNTEYVFAAVVYTGNETKFGMNKNIPQMKLTYTDRRINLYTVMIFCFQLLLVVLLSPAGVRNITQLSKWYIDVSPQDVTLSKFIVIPLRFLLLNSSMIPISLKVTLEVCKVFYTLYIDKDNHFNRSGAHGVRASRESDESSDYESDDEANVQHDRQAYCNSSCLSENLGQVRYIFTDKTGTLTKNEMILKYVSINHTGIELEGEQTKVESDEATMIAMKEFLRCSLLCNSIVIDKGVYKCDSPDELCLVHYCQYLGGKLINKDGNLTTISINGEEETWVICKTLDFTSERKRMSVLAYNEEKPCYCLYTKGADDVMLLRTLKKGIWNGINLEDNSIHIIEDLQQYADQGLRTLVMGRKEFEEGKFKEYVSMVSKAERVIENRDEVKAECYEEIEHHIIAVGASGIEDLLQDDVKDTIQYLRDCGVSVWMITGDKPNTAISIGRSTGIIDEKCDNSRIILLDGEHVKMNTNEVRDTILKSIRSINAKNSGFSTLCVTGSMFSFITTSQDTSIVDNTTLLQLLLTLAMKVNSVIFCRVFPKQKSEVVDIMKKATHQVTLAIGDGGNDVIMIQSSDVGVGVIGKEGQQAARAADYVVSEFRHLKRLMCVHGVNSASRSWTIASYSLYKSIVFCIIQTMYSVFSSYSGVSLFNSFQIAAYNVILFFPIVMMVTKQIYSSADLMNRPRIYQYYNNSDNDNKITMFTVRRFLAWVLIGVVEAIILEVLTIVSNAYAPFDFLTNTIFYANIWTQDLVMILLLPNITMPYIVMIILSHLCLFFICLLTSTIPGATSFVPYLSMQYTLDQRLHYWTTFLVALLPLCLILVLRVFGNRKRSTHM